MMLNLCFFFIYILDYGTFKETFLTLGLVVEYNRHLKMGIAACLRLRRSLLTNMKYNAVVDRWVDKVHGLTMYIVNPFDGLIHVNDTLRHCQPIRWIGSSQRELNKFLPFVHSLKLEAKVKYKIRRAQGQQKPYIGDRRSKVDPTKS